MKNAIRIIVPILLWPALSQPSAAQTWVTTTEDYLADQVERAIQTRDGRFLAVANTGRSLTLVKRNSDGSLLWQRQLMGEPPGEAGFDILELPDGRIVAAGDLHVEAHGNDDAGLVILSADAGTVLLQRAFGGRAGDDRALGLVPASDGGYLLVGETRSWGGPGRRMLMVRVDAGGALLWTKVLGSAAGDDVLRSGVELPSGEFLVAGGSGSVLKIGPAGSLLWSRTYGLAEIREIVAAPGGLFVLAGWRPYGSDDVAELVKIDEAGQIRWRASYGQPGVSYRFFAAASIDGAGVLAGGEVNGPGVADFNGWITRLDPDGAILWQRRLDDPGGEIHTVAAARDGSLLVGGHRSSFPRMMLARLDASGQVPGCGHTATSAMRLASSADWTADTRTEIDASWLVVTDTARPVGDAASPGDQTHCSGGPAYPPSEVSPSAADAGPLVFLDGTTLAWEDAAPSFSTRFRLYRGDVAGLRAGRGPDCLFDDLGASTAPDSEAPVAGAAFFYLVAGTNAAGPGPLGRGSDGSEMQPATACP